MTSNERILQPFTLPNGTELKNRLLMAPMTTCTGYFDGTVTSELVEYYRGARRKHLYHYCRVLLY
ncbi:putative NADH:flavin oxidoreductase [Klebsiella pneumoniae]|uniref:Putative NADH:flavin oxidoreductase n=1 Tax=Klebsiella pneumoniae TaxID=573 RepID=A0A378F4N8_KLEPN|nr:putative NADH:flavin oxidoreductase [Klebsiella pneumoniae]